MKKYIEWSQITQLNTISNPEIDYFYVKRPILLKVVIFFFKYSFMTRTTRIEGVKSCMSGECSFMVKKYN